MLPPTAAVADWLPPTDNPDRALATLTSGAHDAAAELDHSGGVALTVIPGNGYRYEIMLTRLNQANADEWGGNLLVSLPEWNVCMLLNENGDQFHVPYYVEEKLKIGPQHSAVLAVFLTLLSHA